MGSGLDGYTPTNPAGDRTPREGAWAIHQPIGAPPARVWVHTISRASGVAVVAPQRGAKRQTIPLQHLRGA